MLLWTIAVVGALAALVAWMQTRRLRRRLDALNHTYWELRYEHTKLRAAVARLESGKPAEPPPESPTPAPGASFVPLAALRKP
jgi:hypothetical protein